MSRRYCDIYPILFIGRFLTLQKFNVENSRAFSDSFNRNTHLLNYRRLYDMIFLRLNNILTSNRFSAIQRISLRLWSKNTVIGGYKMKYQTLTKQIMVYFPYAAVCHEYLTILQTDRDIRTTKTYGCYVIGLEKTATEWESSLWHFIQNTRICFFSWSVLGFWFSHSLIWCFILTGFNMIISIFCLSYLSLSALLW